MISELEEINRTGSEIREERNARAHQGAADLLNGRRYDVQEHFVGGDLRILRDELRPKRDL